MFKNKIIKVLAVIGIIAVFMVACSSGNSRGDSGSGNELSGTIFEASNGEKITFNNSGTNNRRNGVYTDYEGDEYEFSYTINDDGTITVTTDGDYTFYIEWSAGDNSFYYNGVTFEKNNNGNSKKDDDGDERDNTNKLSNTEIEDLMSLLENELSCNDLLKKGLFDSTSLVRPLRGTRVLNSSITSPRKGTYKVSNLLTFDKYSFNGDLEITGTIEHLLEDGPAERSGSLKISGAYDADLEFSIINQEGYPSTSGTITLNGNDVSNYVFRTYFEDSPRILKSGWSEWTAQEFIIIEIRKEFPENIYSELVPRRTIGDESGTLVTESIYRDDWGENKIVECTFTDYSNTGKWTISGLLLYETEFVQASSVSYDRETYDANLTIEGNGVAIEITGSAYLAMEYKGMRYEGGLYMDGVEATDRIYRMLPDVY